MKSHDFNRKKNLDITENKLFKLYEENYFYIIPYCNTNLQY